MRGVEELAGVFLRDGFDGDSVGDAGEEVAAVLARGEWGQGGAKGIRGLVGGLPVVAVFAILGAIGSSPSLAATLDGRVIECGVGLADGVVGCGGGVVLHWVFLRVRGAGGPDDS